MRCLKVVLFKSLQQDPDLFTDLKSSPGDGSAGEGHRAGRSSRPEKCTEASVEVWTSRMECERRVLCHTMRAASAVLADLYSRWARRPFSSSALWEIPVSRHVLTVVLIGIISLFVWSCYLRKQIAVLLKRKFSSTPQFQ